MLMQKMLMASGSATPLPRGEVGPVYTMDTAWTPMGITYDPSADSLWMSAGPGQDMHEIDITDGSLKRTTTITPQWGQGGVQGISYMADTGNMYLSTNPASVSPHGEVTKAGTVVRAFSSTQGISNAGAEWDQSRQRVYISKYGTVMWFGSTTSTTGTIYDPAFNIAGVTYNNEKDTLWSFDYDGLAFVEFSVAGVELDRIPAPAAITTFQAAPFAVDLAYDSKRLCLWLATGMYSSSRTPYIQQVGILA